MSENGYLINAAIPVLDYEPFSFEPVEELEDGYTFNVRVLGYSPHDLPSKQIVKYVAAKLLSMPTEDSFYFKLDSVDRVKAS